MIPSKKVPTSAKMSGMVSKRAIFDLGSESKIQKRVLIIFVILRGHGH